ncbi:MAG: LysM peptidoglycan-binding domain-containing protein [Bacteroidales bacterium]|nr:LysM peptidoglycan-binding domain-containing protein [Bacteroidales bacterium]
MNHRTILTILLAATVLSLSPAAAQIPDTQTRKINPVIKSRKQLQKENEDMKSEIEVLRQQLKDLEEQYHASDSIASEMIEIYEENEERGLDGLSPEDYTPELTDSLLNLWYRSRQFSGLGRSEDEEYNMDSVHFTSDVPDSVLLKRLAAMNAYITLPYNETVKNYIILYSEKMPTKMAHMLALADYYMPIFEETFNKYNMPQELKYMAVIESALNPVAVSRAGAKGMWQFMYSTARNYGLKINSYVDERLDPVKSADAAARYLQDAYRIFGDWNLAISSYNCGSGNVNKAIRRAGGNKDFWAIYEYLPRETRGYVPAFVGAMYAFRYYKEYGLVPENLEMPAHVDTFAINRNLHFMQVSELVGVPLDLLRDMNPQYIHDVIPGNEGASILRLPSQFTTAFIDHEDSVYTYRQKELFSPATLENLRNAGTSSTQLTYVVKKGDYLGKIAARNGVSVSQIKQWNNLRSNNLRIGQRLVIYKGGAPKATAVASTAKTSSSASASSGQSGYTTYTVRKGDTLYKIASRYPGVSSNDIMKYNGISSSIKAGQKIKIPQK